MKKLSLKMVALIAAMMMCLTAEAKTEDVGGRVIDMQGEPIAVGLSVGYFWRRAFMSKVNVLRGSIYKSSTLVRCSTGSVVDSDDTRIDIISESGKF